ncbi:sorbitol dehydrogenase [Nakamurella endophytica]|uniref:Sorbitol dehydrogenase n=1 Tax=Nakamurella endophytica TaxID=1748367 RepID=A0A917WBD4_9ACTN|nr:sorbitol dehydrogenase [Nakamurella endophytica]
MLRGVGDLAVEQRPVPSPALGEVLIRVGSVGVCGSDVHYFRHGRIGDYVVRQPLVLGHEGGGTIVAVGEGVDSSRLGQRVAMEPGVPDRICRECKAGRYNLCPNVRFFATPPIDGCFAEFVTLAADFAHPVPDSISDDGAGLIEPLSVGVWACGKVGVGPGSRVLISGAGPIGLMNAQVARALGATEIIVSDVAPTRLEAATRFGATVLVDAREPDAIGPQLEVDAFIDCSGAPPAVRQGITAVRPAGRVALVGMGADELSLPVSLIQNRELTVTGTFRYANTYPTAIALAAAGRVDLDGMVTGHFGLDDVESALSADKDPANLKVIVEPGRR